MAALNRNGFFALRLYSSNARGISSSSKWLASDSSGVSKKVDVPSEETQFETTFPRSKQMETLIEVEGAVDLTQISVRTKKMQNHYYYPIVHNSERSLVYCFTIRSFGD